MQKNTYLCCLLFVLFLIQACSSKKSDILVDEDKYTFLFKPTEEDSISIANLDYAKLTNLYSNTSGFDAGKKEIITNWNMGNYNNANNIPNINLNYKSLVLKQKIKLKKARKNIDSSLLNTFIATTEGTIFVSANNETINAIKDNEVIWHKTFEGNIVGTAYDLGFLYVTTYEGIVYGIDARDGSVSWKKEIGTTIKTAPLLFETSVYIKDTNNSIYSLSIYDGSTLWSKTGQKPKIELKAYHSNAANQSLAVFALSNGNIIGVRRETGQLLWERKTDTRVKINELSSISDIKSNPVIYGNYVFISTYNNKTFYLNAINGDIIWSNKINSILNPIVTADRILLIDRNNALININKKNGKIIWGLELKSLLKDTKKTKDIIWYRPLLVNSSIMVSNSKGDIYFLSHINKTLEHHIEVKKGILSNPIIYKNKLLILTKKGEVLIYESDD